MKIAIWPVILGVVLAFGAAAQPLTEEQRLSDLNQLKSVIQSGYGPLAFKAQEQGISLDAVHDSYLSQLVDSPTNGDFYYLVNRYVAEFNDSHFRAGLPSNRLAVLGFSVDLVAGEVLIDKIDRNILPEEQFPFERGDTVIAIDGVAALELAGSLMRHIGAGSPQTALRAATMMLARRVGAYVPIPEGDVVVRVQSRLQPWVVKDLTLKWIVTGEVLDEGVKRRGSLAELDISVADFYRVIFGNDAGKRGEQDFRCSGGTRIKIPADATVIMKEPFVAYMHPTPRGQIGYLRIPHYSPVNTTTGESEHDLRLQQYEYVLAKMEQETVGLIIDQDHNCGGSVSFLENLVGLFMAEPYDPIKFQFLATKAEYLRFKGYLAEMDPHTLDYQNFSEVVELVKSTWQAGNSHLTPTTSFSGSAKLTPRGTYTKPIVMLIDELSGSGGDAFPALMQGYGRAKLLGTRTMGAGGHVQEQPDLFFSGMKLRMTKSLFFRPDGTPIENNGAEPDVRYNITKDDFVNEYTGYQAFYLQTLFEML